MTNTRPCAECTYYDPILRGMVPTKRGWCAKKSKYPAYDSPGQQTPKGAERVASLEEPAKPVLVKGAQVQSTCLSFRAKKQVLSKQDLLQKVKR